MAQQTNSSLKRQQRLLMLARDLLQLPDTHSVLLLCGAAVRDTLATDAALLLVLMPDRAYVTAYDDKGRMCPVSQQYGLYRQARSILDRSHHAADDVVPAPGTDLAEVETQSEAAGQVMIFPFPPINPIGVLAAKWNQPRPEIARAGDMSILRTIGELAGAALGNADFRQLLEQRVQDRTEEIAVAARQHAQELLRRDNVEEELLRISVTDVMTGLLNRRGFFLQAEQGLQQARQQGLASTLIFIDIDRLKRMNDEFGHEAGDKLIRDAAQVLQHSFRSNDVLARLGGDEFAAYTLDSTHPDMILARIRQQLNAFRQHSDLPYPLEFSLGVVQCSPDSDTSLADYLDLADREMYQLKKHRH